MCSRAPNSPPRDPAYPFASKYSLHLHKTYQSGILGQGGGVGEGGGGRGQCQLSEKWFITLKSSFTVYENENFIFEA